MKQINKQSGLQEKSYYCRTTRTFSVYPSQRALVCTTNPRVVS